MIKTIHGVPIPPRKKKAHRLYAQTIDFVITGAIPSKKNRQIATINWNKMYKLLKNLFTQGEPVTLKRIYEAMRQCKPHIRHSKKFQEWEAEKKTLVSQQAGSWATRLRAKGYDVIFPIDDASITITHYWKDNAIRDNSNKAETIHDLLVYAGILKGDNWQCLTPCQMDADCYDGEITDHITVIQITGYNWCKKPGAVNC